MCKFLIVGGTFDRGGGKPSRVIEQLAEGFCSRIGEDVRIQNGGTLDQLGGHLGSIEQYECILWFPNISNAEPYKYVQDVKKKHPTCILVVSKRNDDNRYDFAQLMQRALIQRAALLVEFHSPPRRESGSRVVGRVLDPLGNCFQSWTADANMLGRVLAGRTLELRKFTRVRSQRIETSPPPLPNGLEPFFELIRRAAEKFHELVPTTNEDRFLGNSSFRCQRGFPSVSIGGQIWVSRRNIDKRFIGPNGFVPVEPGPDSTVLYYGEHQPSVDTPIHLRLYHAMDQMRYAIHGHVYVVGAPMTPRAIPCGALEEADAILAAVPLHNVEDFAVNLRGHGFVAMATSVESLGQYLDRLKARPTPEML